MCWGLGGWGFLQGSQAAGFQKFVKLGLPHRAGQTWPMGNGGGSEGRSWDVLPGAGEVDTVSRGGRAGLVGCEAVGDHHPPARDQPWTPLGRLFRWLHLEPVQPGWAGEHQGAHPQGQRQALNSSYTLGPDASPAAP